MSERRRRRASRDEILAQLEASSRSPFRELAADFLHAKPDIESIRAAAKKSPDRYAQGLTQAARLAGIVTDRIEINAGDSLVALAQRLQNMSDSEFEQARLEHERSRALPVLHVVESVPPPKSQEAEQRAVQLRRSEKGRGVLRPADIVAQPAPTPAPQRVRYNPDCGNSHGSPPPPNA
jgi:hypothetical protein